MLDIIAIPKGFLLGIGSAIPLGPIALLVINNTIRNSRHEGFLAGVGGSFADAFFAAISLLTISVFYEFIRENENFIAVIGGSIITIIGVLSTLSKKEKKHYSPNQTSNLNKHNTLNIGKLLQGFFIAISNPGALLWSITLIAILRAGTAAENLTSVIITILFTFIGSASYWYFATFFIKKYSNRVRIENFSKINIYAGIGIAVFGIILIIKGIIHFI